MLLGIPRSARCVQRFDDSLNSAIHITYRISLRSSSMGEPRDPLSKVVFCFYLRSYSDIQLLGMCKGVLAADKILAYRPSLAVHRCVDMGEGVGAHIVGTPCYSLMIHLQVHLQIPCYDFYFL